MSFLKLYLSDLHFLVYYEPKKIFFVSQTFCCQSYERREFLTELRVSVKLIRSLVEATLFRPLFPRPPFGSLASNSSVGESQKRGGAQSCFVQSINVPTYVFPRQVTFTARTPPSVSCQTIPSKVTDVPGSQGPKQSGSVIVPIEVPTHTSIIFLESLFKRFIGGEFVILPSSLLVLDV